MINHFIEKGCVDIRCPDGTFDEEINLREQNELQLVEPEDKLMEVDEYTLITCMSLCHLWCLVSSRL